MLKCPECKKTIHQKYAAWTNKEPSISKRAYDCPDCRTRFIETVDVGSCRVVRVESMRLDSVVECLDDWFE